MNQGYPVPCNYGGASDISHKYARDGAMCQRTFYKHQVAVA